MQQFIDSFTEQYRLTRADVMAIIEDVFSDTLTKWYRKDVMAFFGMDMLLEVEGYNTDSGILVQRAIDLAKIKGKGTLRRLLKEKLAVAAVLKQVDRYKYYEHELLWGEITDFNQEGRAYVIETEIIPGEPVTAFCPLNRIGVHERRSGNFAIGERRAFHLRRVEPVMLNGTPRLNLVVDRVSKTLVEKLLLFHLGVYAERVKLCCIHRYVGQKSVVRATRRLPKATIVAVDRELQERVNVYVRN